jgi:hypothetical protein
VALRLGPTWGFSSFLPADFSARAMTLARRALLGRTAGHNDSQARLTLTSVVKRCKDSEMTVVCGPANNASGTQP